MNWFSRILSGNSAAAAEWPADAQLIDVRSPGEFASGHVPGASNLPLEQVASHIQQLAPDKSRPLLVYCRSGMRSASACKLLQQLGYQEVINGGGVSAVALRLGRPVVGA